LREIDAERKVEIRKQKTQDDTTFLINVLKVYSTSKVYDFVRPSTSTVGNRMSPPD